MPKFPENNLQSGRKILTIASFKTKPIEQSCTVVLCGLSWQLVVTLTSSGLPWFTAVLLRYPFGTINVSLCVTMWQTYLLESYHVLRNSIRGFLIVEVSVASVGNFVTFLIGKNSNFTSLLNLETWRFDILFGKNFRKIQRSWTLGGKILVNRIIDLLWKICQVGILETWSKMIAYCG